MSACDYLVLNVTTLSKTGQEKTRQAVAIANGLIAWCGEMDQLPTRYTTIACPQENAGGRLMTPGLIDCHTHLVYGGSHRAHEFKQRLEGVPDAAIAANGGGISATVKATRALSEDQLLEQSLPRLTALRADGVTTVEIKSGYGLDLANELKMLRVARRLGVLTGIRVVTTFLGAHAVPPEFTNRSQAYIDYLCNVCLPAVAASGLADAVDVFCETMAFTCQQTEQIFMEAQRYSLPIKCHAEQLSASGASVLTARFNGCSSDHLEYLDADGVAAMAKANTVAVLLPGSNYYLREAQKPPVPLLRAAGVGMALATNCNPGTSPTTSLPLMMNMGCQLFGLTVPEALSAVTYQAARALRLEALVGSIEIGCVADLVLWSFQDSTQLCASFGYPLAHKTMIAGKWQHA